MSTAISTSEEQSVSTGGKKIFFKLVEGSNYKVLMTYEFEQVIEFEQFQKLAKALFGGDGDFVTINDIIVAKRDIKMIMPTTDLTPGQKLLREQQQKEKQAIEREKEEILRKVQEHRAEYLRSKGDDRTLFAVMQDTALLREIAADFEAKYPELAKRRDELTEIT